VFEARRPSGGRPSRLAPPLERLAASARAIELPLPAGLEDLAARAIDAAGGGDLVLRLICTKGPEGTPPGSAGGGPVAVAICTDIPASYGGDGGRGRGGGVV